MRNQRNWLFGMIGSICLLTIFCSSVSADSSFFLSQVPTVQDGSITIDGGPSDWNGVAPIVSDSPTDSICGPGTDIKAIYLAKDGNYLYWRVDTADGIFSFDGSPDSKILVLVFLEPPNTANGPYWNGLIVNAGDPNAGYVSGRYNNHEWIDLYGGPEYGTVGTVAEGRIALAEFTPFNIIYINAYYWRGDVTLQCDEANRYFTAPTPTTLTTTKIGTGNGSVSSNPGNISWNGSVGTANFNSGDSVTLTASPGPGSLFSGWSAEDCSGTDVCMLTMDGAKAVRAIFTDEAFAASSSALFKSNIPTVPEGSITIDGSPAEWISILPIVSDPPDDSICGPGTDVKDFYLARDDTYLYWRVDAADGIFSFGSPEDRRFLVLLFYEPNSPNGPYPNGLMVNISDPNSGYLSGRYTNQEGIDLYGGPEYGTVGTVAEGRIALAEFAPFNIETINAYYWRGPNVTPQCDDSWRSFALPPPPPLPPIVIQGSVGSIYGVPIGGARVEQAENPNIFTTTANNGSFTISGLPIGTPFSLRISSEGYVTEYSDTKMFTVNPVLPYGFGLATYADMSGWNMEPGKSAIIGQVRDNGTPQQPLAGAVVTCISSLHQDACPYPIAYANPGATGSNGKYRIYNVDPGDTVTVAASKPEIDFASRTFAIHADGISFGYINQISPSDPTLTVSKSGTGSGSVSASTGAISWTGNNGTANYNSGTVVTLTAEPDPGSIFTAWSGSCDIVDGNKCIIMKTSATTVTATFEHTNRAPVFTPVAPIQTVEGRLVQFTLDATDPDGDSITYYTEPLPRGASFDPAARVFLWIPDYDQAGTYTIHFFAQDDGTPQSKIGDTYVTISVSVPPPEVLINQTIDAVYAFQLPKEVENSYTANLKKVGTFIQGGKLIPAVNELSTTLKKVEKDRAQGKIDEAQGNKLILMLTLLMNGINS